MKHRYRIAAVLTFLLVLSGCSVDPKRKAKIESGKPVATSGSNKDPDWRPKTHTVVKGDTLYSLSLEYGLDYKDIARWSGVVDPNAINVGQVLQLTGPEEVVQITPIIIKKPVLQEIPAEVFVSQPKALKLPYSETALLDLNRLLKTPASVVLVSPAPKLPQVLPESQNKPEVSKEPKNPPVTPQKPEISASGDDEELKCVLPARGKWLSRYSENGNKGLDIAGNKGQAIFSCTVGKVVYSGSGLRGYGKLIIIKHNKTYLTAYAHNQAVLVKEGDSVNRGQKIAEMGDSDSDVVKLHFEIRRYGKPVDPSKYLPAETKP